MIKGKSAVLLSERSKIAQNLYSGARPKSAMEGTVVKTEYRRLQKEDLSLNQHLNASQQRKKKNSDPVDYSYELARVRTLPEISRNKGNMLNPPRETKATRSRSAPSSPVIKPRRRPLVKTSSFTSLERLLQEERADKERSPGNRRQSLFDSTCSTPPVSPALRRKLEGTDKIVRGARVQIDDFRHENPLPKGSAVDPKSLEEALNEVKNCRYLRVFKK